jgi:hypothetical protein
MGEEVEKSSCREINGASLRLFLRCFLMRDCSIQLGRKRLVMLRQFREQIPLRGSVAKSLMSWHSAASRNSTSRCLRMSSTSMLQVFVAARTSI